MIRTLVSTLVSPLVWGLMLMVAALALSFTERFGRAARRALAALVAVGWLLGTGPVADALIHPPERPYGVADPEALMAVSPSLVGFPVHAGMDPGSRINRINSERLPRAHGDGPSVPGWSTIPP